ncbi:MAG: helix-turn-helix transcriptional regulator [Clostridia bacterium]|nr:helix-turn-helix transcriptional regulator [Clostridia bacterium]
MNTLKKIIANNLIILRKEHKLTQSELAEKLNYSDKAISKWEKGETLPDIEILSKITDMYGVSFDYLIHEGTKEDKKQYIKNDHLNKLLVSLLAVSVVWILAALIFIYLFTIQQLTAWNVFVWAVPISCLVLIVFSRRLQFKDFTSYYYSLLVWSLLASVYLQFLQYNIWLIFILGIPLQISIILWAKIKKRKQ